MSLYCYISISRFYGLSSISTLVIYFFEFPYISSSCFIGSSRSFTSSAFFLFFFNVSFFFLNLLKLYWYLWLVKVSNIFICLFKTYILIFIIFIISQEITEIDRTVVKLVISLEFQIIVYILPKYICIGSFSK